MNAPVRDGLGGAELRPVKNGADDAVQFTVLPAPGGISTSANGVLGGANTGARPWNKAEEIAAGKIVRAGCDHLGPVGLAGGATSISRKPPASPMS